MTDFYSGLYHIKLPSDVTDKEIDVLKEYLEKASSKNMIITSKEVENEWIPSYHWLLFWVWWDQMMIYLDQYNHLTDIIQHIKDGEPYEVYCKDSKCFHDQRLRLKENWLKNKEYFRRRLAP